MFISTQTNTCQSNSCYGPGPGVSGTGGCSGFTSALATTNSSQSILSVTLFHEWFNVVGLDIREDVNTFVSPYKASVPSFVFPVEDHSNYQIMLSHEAGEINGCPCECSWWLFNLIPSWSEFRMLMSKSFNYYKIQQRASCQRQDDMNTSAVYLMPCFGFQ